jgi:hypothetical protein
VTPEQFNEGMQLAQLAVAVVATSGLGAMAVKWLQAKGIDTKAVLNDSLVSAAVNAAPGLLKDVLVSGKSITDPALIAGVVTALTTSLNATHDTTIAKLGATSADVARIATNAVGASIKDTLDATAQAASASTSPVEAVLQAKQLLTAVSVAAAPVASTLIAA